MIKKADCIKRDFVIQMSRSRGCKKLRHNMKTNGIEFVRQCPPPTRQSYLHIYNDPLNIDRYYCNKAMQVLEIMIIMSHQFIIISMLIN